MLSAFIFGIFGGLEFIGGTGDLSFGSTCLLPDTNSPPCPLGPRSCPCAPEDTLGCLSAFTSTEQMKDQFLTDRAVGIPNHQHSSSLGSNYSLWTWYFLVPRRGAPHTPSMKMTPGGQTESPGRGQAPREAPNCSPGAADHPAYLPAPL